MPTFYCNYFFAFNSGAPYTRGPLDFAYPAYPVVTPLTNIANRWIMAVNKTVKTINYSTWYIGLYSRSYPVCLRSVSPDTLYFVLSCVLDIFILE